MNFISTYSTKISQGIALTESEMIAIPKAAKL